MPDPRALPILASPLWDAHLTRLLELLRIEAAPDEALCRRRSRQATARQCLQGTIRREAVACYHRLHDQGLTLGECSLLLHLASRTLRAWDQEYRSATTGLLPVGRPPRRSPLPVRQAILDYLKLTGPGVGVPALHAHFHDVARGELADLLARYRAVYRARQRHDARVLHWQTPGSVWAADFTETRCWGGTGSASPGDGGAPYLLAVRDLASGFMLAWQPLPALTEEVTRAALERLFLVHGVPLVLKVDNGSAFRAWQFQALLQRYGVIPLYSPPACPGYNGAIEAAIGSLKTRTENQAHAAGRPGQWRESDLRAAQAAANASHPRRLNGRTPTSVWESRNPVDPGERVRFALSVDGRRLQVKNERSIAWEEPLDHWRQSAVDRHAIERALVEHGCLLFTRRRVPLRIRARKGAADV